MTSKPDYFALLGVTSDADGEQLRTAFRKLARQYHPDAEGGGDPESFRRVRKAYEVLSDPRTRREYVSGGQDVPVWVEVRSPRFEQRRRNVRQTPRSHLDLSDVWGPRRKPEEFDELLAALFRLMRYP